MTLYSLNPKNLDELFENKNFLVLNSHLSETKQNELLVRVQDFFKENKEFDSPVILVPTSGTQSFYLKLVLLKIQALLNSAKCVGSFFNFSRNENWLLTLPLFHVGGLGIVARAYEFQQNVFHLDKWSLSLFYETLYKNNIHLTSLVPTQIFDIVNQKLKAPKHLRLVFVGGGSLSESLFVAAKSLDWPIVKTFGMTETASMVATSDQTDDSYSGLPGCQFKISKENNLMIQCDSLFSGYLSEQGSDKKFIFTPPKIVNNFWISEDLAESKEGLFFLKGREKDLIKIKGELVNLFSLRSLLLQEMEAQQVRVEMTIISIPDLRNENKLVLIISQESLNPFLESSSALNNFVSEKIIPRIQEFNKKLLPFEQIKLYFIIDFIPRTDLGKIKYSELCSLKNMEVINENRKPILE
ncbi:MAG: AMP-binding protein [Deltaproteobacteria bacterium]|nr:AMP-binding protein [Deltaproteobacteria bacterium]